jgi:Gpi18-like mannosyltransferase
VTPFARYAVVIAIGLVIRVALLPGKGFPTDISAFTDWAVALATVGPHELYADVSGKVFPTVDYPPGYAYVLWLIGIVYTHVCGCTDPDSTAIKILVKLPAVLADFALAGMIARLAARFTDSRTAFLTFTVTLLAPPLWLVSAYWGQVDSVATLLLIAALSFGLEGHFVAGWTIFAVALMTKPQALVALPALLVWEIRSRGLTLGLVVAAFSGAAAAYLLAVPFAPVVDPIGVLRWVVERYSVGIGKYPNGSTGAFNLYGIGNNFYTSDAQTFVGIPLHTWGSTMVAIVVLGAAAVLWWALGRARGSEREMLVLFAAFVSLCALFMLATRMHERYLMPALAVGAVVAAFDRRALTAQAIFATIFTINCAFILVGFAGGKHHPIALYAGHAFAFVNVATFLALGAAFIRRAILDGRSIPATAPSAA